MKLSFPIKNHSPKKMNFVNQLSGIDVSGNKEEEKMENCNVSKAFEELDGVKKAFWEGHAQRKAQLDAALDSLAAVTAEPVDDEVSKDLNKIGQDLENLLNDSSEEDTVNEEETIMNKPIATYHHPEVAEMLSMWAKTRLEHFINVMPNGQFMNGHNQKIETCDGLVMLASGEVCPIFYNSICCLNPLSTERHDDCACLSTFSVAGNVVPDATSITKTVERYNRDQAQFVKTTGIGGFGRYAIIAYHSFKSGW
jgi:hypothetical protein